MNFLVVDQFILVEPVINLEVAQNGRPNWQFAPAGAQPAPATPTASQPSAASDGGSPLSQLRLGDVRIENGKLTYRDAKAGTTETLEAVNLKLKLPSIEQPFDAEGSVTWKGKPIKVTAHVANPRALLVDNRAFEKVSEFLKPEHFYAPAHGRIYEAIAKEFGAYYIPQVMEGILSNPQLKSDPIHPNGAGYRLMAQRMAGKIRPLLRAADRSTGRRGF